MTKENQSIVLAGIAFLGLALLLVFAVATSPDSGSGTPAAAKPLPERAARVDPAPCNRLIANGARTGLIRARPASNRIDVEDRLWAQLPASSKRGVMLALRCSMLDGHSPLGTMDEYVVAYGYRSGRRLAIAGASGVRFE